MVTPLIQRPDTIMREALPANEKLEITFAFLASGTNFRMLPLLFCVSKEAISALIRKVCEAIRQCLKYYMKVIAGSIAGWKVLANLSTMAEIGIQVSLLAIHGPKTNAMRGASRNLNMAE
ncbi:hypothetical protein PR048_025302 [Dryococelus australis]|uniref:Uncharacterized protein n=1 Tax=Dryococelus australis TaxID=614101 RepID=A0ABQ9GR18_9NEOP|nr:hypothetical protein PR048_025302 [Dryococelus australis]